MEKCHTGSVGSSSRAYGRGRVHAGGALREERRIGEESGGCFAILGGSGSSFGGRNPIHCRKERGIPCHGFKTSGTCGGAASLQYGRGRQISGESPGRIQSDRLLSAGIGKDLQYLRGGDRHRLTRLSFPGSGIHIAFVRPFCQAGDEVPPLYREDGDYPPRCGHRDLRSAGSASEKGRPCGPGGIRTAGSVRYRQASADQAGAGGLLPLGSRVGDAPGRDYPRL